MTVATIPHQRNFSLEHMEIVLGLYLDTMTKATLKSTTFNWGWLIGSEDQSIIIKVGTWQHPGRRVEALRVLHLYLKAANQILASRKLR